MRTHIALLGLPAAHALNDLAKTPPMVSLCINAVGARVSTFVCSMSKGWMSWEIFRCNLDTPTDNCTDPLTTACISEALYHGVTDALVTGGFVAAGYGSVHMDDCWEQLSPPRDPVTKQLVPDPKRFPSGQKALCDYVHDRGVQCSTYTAESPYTCGGYPGSQGFEALDADTFAAWGKCRRVSMPQEASVNEDGCSLQEWIILKWADAHPTTTTTPLAMR
jgi:hypothetical protein